MSLQSLRNLRLQRLRPTLGISLLTRACPWPHYDWYEQDPTKVWVPGPDVRAYDLRALTGLKVTAFVESVALRREQVAAALEAVGAKYFAITDGKSTEIGPGCVYPEVSLPMTREWLADFWSLEWN